MLLAETTVLNGICCSEVTRSYQIKGLSVDATMTEYKLIRMSCIGKHGL